MTYLIAEHEHNTALSAVGDTARCASVCAWTVKDSGDASKGLCSQGCSVIFLGRDMHV
jgi:hypothetical protein